MYKIVTSMSVILLLCCNISNGGLDTISAEDAAANDVSVIVARVKEIKKVSAVWGQRIVTVEPLATIAGSFDPSVAKLVLTLWMDDAESSVHVQPKADEFILAVIHRYEEYGKARIGIVASVCTFMPEGSACVVVTGMDDKRIWQTLAYVREERTKAAEERTKTAQRRKE